MWNSSKNLFLREFLRWAWNELSFKLKSLSLRQILSCASTWKPKLQARAYKLRNNQNWALSSAQLAASLCSSLLIFKIESIMKSDLWGKNYRMWDFQKAVLLLWIFIHSYQIINYIIYHLLNIYYFIIHKEKLRI